MFYVVSRFVVMVLVMVTLAVVTLLYDYRDKAVYMSALCVVVLL